MKTKINLEILGQSPIDRPRSGRLGKFLDKKSVQQKGRDLSRPKY